MTETIEVVIDLGASHRNASVTDASQLLQREVYDKLLEHVKNDLQAVKKPVDAGYPAGSGLTYFIDGTRGAGKSTFLRYAYEHLSNDLAQNKPVTAVQSLLLLDPSRIEDSEIVLLHVVKALRHKVFDCDRRGCTSERDRWAEEFRQAVTRMAGGLHLFVNGHSALADLDAETFLDYGLSRAGDSQELRSHLHQVIDCACKVIGVDALVLAIDDAETNAESAFQVLECLRKYLDTPRLLTLVTGDMELYSLLVQKQFSHSLTATKSKSAGKGSMALASEGPSWRPARAAQYERMVDHLEEQYLLKLFPAPRRLQLRPVWNLIHAFDSRYSYVVIADYLDGKEKFEELVRQLVRSGLRVKVGADVSKVVEFLLKLPLRSVLQVLLLARPNDSKQSDQQSLGACAEALRGMALSSLYRYGVDVDAVAASELSALTSAVFDLSLVDGESDTGAYLRPQPGDLALRNCFVSLSADVARLCAGSPAKAITYMLSGPGSVAIYHQVARAIQQGAAREGGDELLRAQFKQYLSIGRNEDALNWAWRATVALVSSMSAGSRVVRCGVVGLNRYGSKKTGLNLSIRTAINEAKEDDRPYPAIAFALIDVNEPGGVRSYVSIHNLLGLIVRLLSLPDSTPPKNLESRIYEVLLRASSVAMVSPPTWTSGAIGRDENEVEPSIGSDDGEIASDAALSHLVESIKTWLGSIKNQSDRCMPSALFLGKVWTRLFFSLISASDEMRGSKNGCADLMQVFAACLVNAILVEESEHHLYEGSSLNDLSLPIRAKNPQTSPALLFEKLGRISKFGSELPLTRIIISCPLVIGLFYKGKVGEVYLQLKSSEVPSKQRHRRAILNDLYSEVENSLLGELWGGGESMVCSEKSFSKINEARIVGSRLDKDKKSQDKEDSEIKSLDGANTSTAEGTS